MTGINPTPADRLEDALRHVGRVIRDGLGMELKKRISSLDIAGLFGLDVVAQTLLQAGYQRGHGGGGQLRRGSELQSGSGRRSGRPM